MELQAVTGLLYIVDGVKIEDGDVPGLLAQSAPSGAARGRNRDYLFVHITAMGDVENLDFLYQDLVDSISGNFYKTSGSVTAALRKAIINTNQLLLQHNLAGVGTTVEGSITCVVQHGSELFIAQTGEAFAYIGHNFGVERLSSADNRESTPLGRTAGLDIRFNHSRISDGDLVLLADPRLAHLPTDDLKPVLIDVSMPEGINALEDLVGGDTARAILVEFTEDAPASLPEAERTRSSQTSARILPPPTTSPVRHATATIETEKQLGKAGPLRNIDVDQVETSARKATSKAARGVSKGTGWFADLLSKIRSPEESDEEKSNLAIPTLIALAIPLLVAVIVVGVYIQRGQVALLLDTKNEIHAILFQAGELSEPAQSLILYNQAIDKLNEAEEIRAADPELEEMRKQAMAGIDQLSGVARQSSEAIYQFGPDTQLHSIVVDDVQQGAIYVLDSGENNVYKITTDEQFRVLTADPERVLVGEQVVGNYVVGSMVDMMWRPAGNQVTRDGLAILDQRGALISYFPDFSDLRAVTLDLASQWKSPSSIATFNERLYVVDQGTSAVWRYYPEGEGFKIIEGQESIEFVDEADLENVVDMAIYSEDGSIMLLYNDGRLRRYANGRLLWDEADLLANGLTSPLVAPVSIKIIGRGLNSSVYVADPGSDRLIQLSLGGTFLAQYKASDEFGNELFGRITDFDVAGNPLAILVVTDNTVYVASE